MFNFNYCTTKTGHPWNSRSSFGFGSGYSDRNPVCKKLEFGFPERSAPDPERVRTPGSGSTIQVYGFAFFYSPDLDTLEFLEGWIRNSKLSINEASNENMIYDESFESLKYYSNYKHILITSILLFKYDILSLQYHVERYKATDSEIRYPNTFETD